MHIHSESRAVPTNKVLTAYMEGGELETAPPMRLMGLNGTGEVIGVADTGVGELRLGVSVVVNLCVCVFFMVLYENVCTKQSRDPFKAVKILVHGLRPVRP